MEAVEFESVEVMEFESAEFGGRRRGPNRLCWKWADNPRADSEMHRHRRTTPERFLAHRDPMQDAVARGEVQAFQFCPVALPRAL